MQEQACRQGSSVRHTPAPGPCVSAQLPVLPCLQPSLWAVNLRLWPQQLLTANWAASRHLQAGCPGDGQVSVSPSPVHVVCCTSASNSCRQACRQELDDSRAAPMQKQASLRSLWHARMACWWSQCADAWWRAALPYVIRHRSAPEPQCSALLLCRGWQQLLRGPTETRHSE